MDLRIQFAHLTDAMNAVGDSIVKDAKANLKSKNKVDTGTLETSVNNTGIKFSKNSIQLNLKMSYYGAFIDKGVRGVGGVRKQTSTYKRTNNKGKLWKQKGGKSPYSFKENKKPSVKHFIEWSNRKGLSPYAVRESVFHQGIEPSHFLEDAIKTNIEKIPKQITDAFALDVTNLLNTIIKANLNK